jgi:DNA polymerase alpha-associated DNA helicase A
MNFSSIQFYEGKLIAHDSVKSHTLIDFPNTEKCEETESPLIFLDTTGADYMESIDNSSTGMKLDDSKFNEGEANVILAYIKRLKNWGIQDEDIAIISPYNAQVDLLKLSLREDSPLIEIGTVDGFQGREKLVIIISLVRSNDDFEIGFLKESRRLNVALTRAKCHLVVVCNGEFMISSKDKVLKKMVEYMEEHALIEYAQ